MCSPAKQIPANMFSGSSALREFSSHKLLVQAVESRFQTKLKRNVLTPDFLLFCWSAFLLSRDCAGGQLSCIPGRGFHTTSCLSLGRVFQFHALCRLQASFRDMGQNSVLRRPVDSATCGPELKQFLGLKSACKEPPNGNKGAPQPAASQACDSQTSTRRLLWQLAALPNYSQAARSTSESLPSYSQTHKSLPSSLQATSE